MEPNPFLTMLRIAFTAILAFLVFLSFWQRTHLEDQVAGMTREQSALTDRISDLARKVDDVKSKADRLEGAAETMAQMMASGVRVGPGPTNGGGPATRPAPPRRQDAWGWKENAAIDADLDPSRPVGTPGRYKNFLTLDPDPVIPPQAKGHEDGRMALIFGPQSKTFNPILSTSASLQETLITHCMSSPADEHWRDPYKYGPNLAWRVEVSPDHREYTLFFRRDAVWHPPTVDLGAHPHLRGTHGVTAHDYKFSIDAIMNTQVEAAPLRAYYSDCAGVTVVDDYTAVIRWNKTVFHSIWWSIASRYLLPKFLYAYDERGEPFPEETFGQQFNQHFYNRVGTVGSGPYRMLPYDAGEWLEMERFEDWFGVREGTRFPIKQTRLLVYQDPETPFLKLRAGEISMVGLQAAQWKKWVRDETDPTSPFKDGRIVSYEALRPQYRYIAWKNTHPLFRDKNVRRALTLACNRQQIFEQIWAGILVPMGGPIYPDAPAADPNLVPHPFDLKEAARLLDEAGWKLDPATGLRTKTVDGQRKTFEFELVWNAPAPEADATIKQYRNDLRTIGVALTPVPLEWSLYLQKLHDREYEAALAGWATNSWDQDFEQVWHSKQIQAPKSSNYIEFSNAEVDRLSDELREEMDVEKRKEKARRVGRVIYEEHPVTFLGWVRVKGAHWAWLKNATEHPYKTRPFIRTFPMWVDR
jgi:peptide/nickel transport system substrate-binding protein